MWVAVKHEECEWKNNLVCLHDCQFASVVFCHPFTPLALHIGSVMWSVYKTGILYQLCSATTPLALHISSVMFTQLVLCISCVLQSVNTAGTSYQRCYAVMHIYTSGTLYQQCCATFYTIGTSCPLRNAICLHPWHFISVVLYNMLPLNGTSTSDIVPPYH